MRTPSSPLARGPHPWLRRSASALLGTALLGLSSMAMAQVGAPAAPAPPAAALVDADPDEDQPPPLLMRDSSPRLDGSSGFGIGLEAFGGLALLMTSERANSHAMVGALSRVRFGFVQVGAVLELSDTSEGRWRSVGAFIGGYLPFRNWVDFDGSVGFAMRHHINADPRYGSGGYDVNLPSVTLRLGFSDRTSDEPLAARFGGGLVASFDVGRKDVDWRYESGVDENASVYTGTSSVGGTSLGLIFTAGFDVGVKPRSSPAASVQQGALSLPSRE